MKRNNEEPAQEEETNPPPSSQVASALNSPEVHPTRKQIDAINLDHTAAYLFFGSQCDTGHIVVFVSPMANYRSSTDNDLCRLMMAYKQHADSGCLDVVNLLSLLYNDTINPGFDQGGNDQVMTLEEYWNSEKEPNCGIRALATALLKLPIEDEEEGVEKTKPEPATCEELVQWSSEFSKHCWTMAMVEEDGGEYMLPIRPNNIYADSLAKITAKQHCIVVPINVYC